MSDRPRQPAPGPPADRESAAPPHDTPSAAPLTLGTAGHIDHGKTALIRALTGTDTDRLPQEQARGISIELGYAKLALPSGRTVSVIDVPGHERFVRTMVAGATGIDFYLMTIAADDGVMPQTREHAAVLRALEVDTGVVAVTKADLAPPAAAIEEARELLPRAEVVAVSSRTGAGLDALARALDRAAAPVRSRADADGASRLHVDRVFTIRGAGTVVTGTLWAGDIGRGDLLVVLPSGRRARVRGVQVHDRPVSRAQAGQRVAVNLTGVAVGDVARGDVLTDVRAPLRPTFLLDAALDLGDGGAPPPGAPAHLDDRSSSAAGQVPAHGDRVQVHHGTREASARLAWLGGRFWQLRLEQPLIVAPADRVVIRRIAPPDTLGGGAVLDPHPRKHGASRELLARLERLARGERDDAGLGGREGAASPKPSPAAPSPPAPLTASAQALEHRLSASGFEPPLSAELDSDDLAALRSAGRAVRVSKSLHYHVDAVADARARVIALGHRNGGSVTLSALRDELGTSRKFAQALLEHFDAERITIRRGDEHVLRRRAADG